MMNGSIRRYRWQAEEEEDYTRTWVMRMLKLRALTKSGLWLMAPRPWHKQSGCAVGSTGTRIGWCCCSGSGSGIAHDVVDPKGTTANDVAVVGIHRPTPSRLLLHSIRRRWWRFVLTRFSIRGRQRLPHTFRKLQANTNMNITTKLTNETLS
jgi:hypothetical protein